MAKKKMKSARAAKRKAPVSKRVIRKKGRRPSMKGKMSKVKKLMRMAARK